MIGQRSMRPAATPETSSDISRGLADAATRPLQELLSLPHSSERGLSARDAASILEATGPNRIAPAHRTRRFAGPIGQPAGARSPVRRHRLGLYRRRIEFCDHQVQAAKRWFFRRYYLD